jgi:hypothetical protein
MPSGGSGASAGCYVIMRACPLVAIPSTARPKPGCEPLVVACRSRNIRGSMAPLVILASSGASG